MNVLPDVSESVAKPTPASEGAEIDEKHAANFADDHKGLDLADVVEAAQELTLEDAKRHVLSDSGRGGSSRCSHISCCIIIHDAIEGRQTDPNFDQGLLKRCNEALNAEALSHDVARALVEEIKLEAALMDDSPYVEVRAAVSNVSLLSSAVALHDLNFSRAQTDDPDMYINTFRAWFIGLIFTIIGTGVNIFFSARNPGITLNTFCSQVIAFPVGKAMERWLPTKSVRLFGKQWSLNPGPFNQKEHMLITIMANVTFGGAVGVYATDIVYVQRLPQFFNQDAVGGNAGYQILLTLSTQMIGFALAGFSRRFLVYPPSVLNRSFHHEKNTVANGWSISRLRFFLYVFLGYGFYFVFPDCIMQFLTYFNWMTWIAPNNKMLAIITGSQTGLGLNPISAFDWSYLTALSSPLITPLFASMNMYAGMIIIGLGMIPAIYFTNTWYTGYLLINSNHIFDNTGARYNVSRIINSDFTLNVAAYESYSQVYQSAGNAVVFFAFFAVYTATLMHIILYFRVEVVNGFRAVFQRKNARDAYNDVHNRLMRKYKEVPEWWFFAVFVVSLVFGIVANEHYHTEMPVWVVPVGIIEAITNIQITMNVLAEVIGGYTLSNRPLAVMIFKTYGYISTAQAIGYVADMKVVFSAQLIASILASFVGLGVADWQIKNISGICTSGNVDDFTCPGYNTFFNSAVQWGAVGPQRLYSEGQIYYPLVYGFLVGAVLPIPIYFLTRRYPNSYWKYLNMPAFLSGALNWSPYNLSYILPCIPIAYYFQDKLAWWTKYNYILSSGLTSAISIFGVIWFFAILYKNYEPVWWGNTVSFAGCDGNGCPWFDMPEKGCFGPAPACPE
ncbi:hypothetical protein RQP46_001206 [Phenoliferia psychrophenolica]